MPVVIIEGILSMSIKKLRDMSDLTIFVDTPLDICFIRRLERDIKERGRTVESVINQYQKTVRPSYWEFIAPSREFADIMVHNGGKSWAAID